MIRQERDGQLIVKSYDGEIADKAMINTSTRSGGMVCVAERNKEKWLPIQKSMRKFVL